MEPLATLFVGNVSSVANPQYLERLFSAYGEVHHVKMKGEEGTPERFAEVSYQSVDDADAAVAALHYRYCTCRDLPLIVLYSAQSSMVSEYGRLVGEEFARAIKEDRPPSHIPLENFDSNYERMGVPQAPTEQDVLVDGINGPMRPATLHM